MNPIFKNIRIMQQCEISFIYKFNKIGAFMPNALAQLLGML
ncbi:hypothetical protein HMPREF0530_1342 [Lacticaseibacillus paracasei subsp. paracasei ATCC 25302 = DSM 5622 = JCM 8130]|uniref:Uncharacterized protein n=1 Tax=Lacticaseibacillus paracasei N1115 TaxID=1446494 RepID=A0A806LBS0_LACPA|nr:hypothetical protein AF91_03530 [Lacticaseibacillus paracasei N1115]EEI68376.1 hypothetical protein HMPREF0530_1342 [Lacticaseibacillus paracasei subsp. paracasei ATCC 25302 = DSM 5622 = JCM 8130]GEL32246.1 hypothetical protein LPA04_27070 [Lacticaseibacillus paracasei subsp. paracasei]